MSIAPFARPVFHLSRAAVVAAALPSSTLLVHLFEESREVVPHVLLVRELHAHEVDDDGADLGATRSCVRANLRLGDAVEGGERRLTIAKNRLALSQVGLGALRIDIRLNTQDKRKAQRV